MAASEQKGREESTQKPAKREYPIVLPSLLKFLQKYPVPLYVSQPVFNPPTEAKWAETARIFIGPNQLTDYLGNFAHRIHDDLIQAGIIPTTTTPLERWNDPTIRPTIVFDEDVDKEVEHKQTTHEPLDWEFAKRSRYRSDTELRVTTSVNQRRTWLDIYPNQEAAMAAYQSYLRKSRTQPVLEQTPESFSPELEQPTHLKDLRQVLGIILNAPTPRQRIDLVRQMGPPLVKLAAMEARRALSHGLIELGTKIDTSK